MKRTVWLWELFGFSITALGGTVLHFLYDWLDEAVWIAPFSGVNESTWEHMKLLFWPMFIYAIIQSFLFKDYKRFWCVKLRGSMLGLLLIPVIFYTFNGAIGKSPDWINIAIFFISAAAVFVYETRALNKEIYSCNHPKLALGMLCILALLFVIFTFKTPEIGIFKDPLNGAFGI